MGISEGDVFPLRSIEECAAQAWVACEIGPGGVKNQNGPGVRPLRQVSLKGGAHLRSKVQVLEGNSEWALCPRNMRCGKARA